MATSTDCLPAPCPLLVPGPLLDVLQEALCLPRGVYYLFSNLMGGYPCFLTNREI